MKKATREVLTKRKAQLELHISDRGAALEELRRRTIDVTAELRAAVSEHHAIAEDLRYL